MTRAANFSTLWEIWWGMLSTLRTDREPNIKAVMHCSVNILQTQHTIWYGACGRPSQTKGQLVTASVFSISWGRQWYLSTSRVLIVASIKWSNKPMLADLAHHVPDKHCRAQQTPSNIVALSWESFLFNTIW